MWAVFMWVVYKITHGHKEYWNGSEFVQGRENALEMTLDRASRVAAETYGSIENASWMRH